MEKKASELRNRNNTLHNRNNTTETAHNTELYYIFIRCHFGPLLFALVFAPYIYPAILHRRSHLAGFHCSSLLGRLFISLAMAKKFFCGSCGHEVVHEVFEEGNCLSCRILLSGKLRNVSDGREPVSYSKDTQTPPDGNGDMHRFIRAMLLRRPDAAID